MKRFLPATVCTLVAAAYVVYRLAGTGWEPTGWLELGDRISGGASEGAEGYDGQFFYYIALDPDPSSVSAKLDDPAYRYQRILYPLIASLVSLGVEAWIPWAMLLIGLAAHWTGTWSVSEVLSERGLSRWYALSYGLWVGLVAPVGIGLSEPLAFALAAAGMLSLERRKKLSAAALFGAAAFAKETTLVFLAAALIAELLTDRQPRAIAAYAASGALFGIWQLWLLATFGTLGLGSGGDMATAFEWMPYMGLIRIGFVSAAAMGLYLLIFGPSIVLPSFWGTFASIRELLRGTRDADTLSLLGNSLLIMILPFSTFREPLGLVRLADGLVLAVILFASARRWLRPLRYSLFWSAMLAMLLPR